MKLNIFTMVFTALKFNILSLSNTRIKVKNDQKIYLTEEFAYF